ncbi:MAG TPA: hypothetical protein VE007_13335 [Thermoanaerobaculia bacterium]|nr:hypothetical protein [Thermoanaerobaculia bacterium]
MRIPRRSLIVASAVAGTLTAAVPLSAASDISSDRGPLLRRPGAAASAGKTPQAATATAYSTEVPLVARIAPTAATDTLILNAAHPFAITLSARDTGRTGNVGTGQAIPENDIFGFFSIPAITGNSSNPEVFVKIIDGRSLNGNYWVFSNGLSDLEYTLTVREVATGRTKTYSKTFGNSNACGTFDTAAFASPPGGAEPAGNVPLDAEAINLAGRASFLRTAVDITNTTNKNGVTADFQYSYTCIAAACSPQNAFYRTPVQTISLQALDSRHFDDIVGYLASLPGVLATGADQGSYGTLLVTFRSLNTSNGFEGTVQSRTYSRVVESDPLKGNVGFETPASLFIEAARATLVGTARNTRSAATTEGTLSSNVGVRNSDINATGGSDNVDLTCYDASTGQRVGNTISLAGLRPGELREVSDLWTAAGIPLSTHTVIVFADIRAGSATIEGYITIDDVNSKDSSFIELKCADAFCGT